MTHALGVKRSCNIIIFRYMGQISIMWVGFCAHTLALTPASTVPPCTKQQNNIRQLNDSIRLSQKTPWIHETYPVDNGDLLQYPTFCL
jgi:hypothetical protein